MESILIHTAIYGILVMAFMNLIVLVAAWRRKMIDWQEMTWMILLILGVGLIASTIFFRKVEKMDWQYNVAILVSLIGLIGMFLRLTKRLIRRPDR